MANKGEIIHPDVPTKTMNKIKEMWAKWGGSSTVQTFSTNETALASKIKSMVSYVEDGKRRSGWKGTVTPAPSVGDNITEMLTSLYNNAESIRTYCACNCNYCSCNCNRCCDGECTCNNGSDS